MEKIDLTARYTREGKIIPLHFTWEGGTIQIRDVGRRWQSEEGNHLLVMDFQNQTYHLLYQWEEASWYLVQNMKPASKSF